MMDLNCQTKKKMPLTTIAISIGYWIHKSAFCAQILHKFVVLLEAMPSAIYVCIVCEYGIQYLTCCTLETTF